MFHYGMSLFCMKHITLQKLQNQIKVPKMSWILKHWVSELCDSMSNRKQKTLTSPTKHIYSIHQNRQNENHSQSSKITQDYILEHGTVSALLLIPGWIRDLEKKDLIIKSKNFWYITGGMDPGPAPAEKRDHLYHIKKWENDLYKGSHCKITCFLIGVLSH